MKKSIRFLDANMLRALACALMLCDHMWATIVPGNEWMTWLGRLAFPIFAFQIAEGFFHTSNFRNYAATAFRTGLRDSVRSGLRLHHTLSVSPERHVYPAVWASCHQGAG